MRLAASCTALLLGAASCSTVEAHLSLVVPDGVDPTTVDLSRVAEGVSIVGNDVVPLVTLVPLGQLSVEDALRDAIGERTDVVLVDVTVTRHLWWAVLYGESTMELKGVMVPLPYRPGSQEDDS